MNHVMTLIYRIFCQIYELLANIQTFILAIFPEIECNLNDKYVRFKPAMTYSILLYFFNLFLCQYQKH